MAKHPSSAAVQEYGCGSLRYLAATNINFKAQIAAAGGMMLIEAAVWALGKQPSSAAIQNQGCLALWNLAAKSDGNKAEIAAAGFI